MDALPRLSFAGNPVTLQLHALARTQSTNRAAVGLASGAVAGAIAG